MTNYVSNYSEEDLLEAVRQRIRRDAKFKHNLEKSLFTKNKKQLQKLVENVSHIVFGIVLKKVVHAVINSLSGSETLGDNFSDDLDDNFSDNE